MSGAGGSSTPGAAAMPIKLSIVHQNADVLPGAALAKQEGRLWGSHLTVRVCQLDAMLRCNGTGVLVCIKLL